MSLMSLFPVLFFSRSLPLLRLPVSCVVLLSPVVAPLLSVVVFHRRCSPLLVARHSVALLLACPHAGGQKRARLFHPIGRALPSMPSRNSYSAAYRQLPARSRASAWPATRRRIFPCPVSTCCTPPNVLPRVLSTAMPFRTLALSYPCVCVSPRALSLSPVISC